MDKHSVTVENLLVSECPEAVQSFFADSPDSEYRFEGYLYYKLDMNVLRCEDNYEGNQIFSLLAQQTHKRLVPGSREDILYQIISKTKDEKAFSLAKQCCLTDRQLRCVILFKAYNYLEKDLYLLFSEVVPTEKCDILIPLMHHSIALVRNLSDCSREETVEYINAVIDTLETEGIGGIKAGIGRTAECLEDLHTSFIEAQSAIETGMRFHPSENVFLYNQQALERIIEKIPRSDREKIHDMFFLKDDAMILNTEMIETVKTFFRNDLNLTATSKQLFIHRNTLNYRLDKVRKETGLDLRRFQDAVVFRIIMEMSV